MIASTFAMQLLAVVALLTGVFANPIKRGDAEVTPVTISDVFGLFTSIATSALTTGELVGVVVVSSQTLYLEEPNFFPATAWGVPEVTPSDIVAVVSSAAGTTTSENTPYSFSTTIVPTTALAIPTFPNSASLTTTLPTMTPVADEQTAVTTSSCNSDVAGVTIPVSDLTIGQFVAAYVTCGKTIYIKEPNFYAPKTYYDIPSSAVVTSSAAAATTGVAVKPRMMDGRTSHTPVIDRTRPTSTHQADENWIKSIPSGVAGNKGAEALRQQGSLRMSTGGL